MRKGVVSEGLGVGQQRNEKQQSPIVECQVYIQYSVINHMKKNKKKYIFYVYTESHCCLVELNATLKIIHTSK